MIMGRSEYLLLSAHYNVWTYYFRSFISYHHDNHNKKSAGIITDAKYYSC